MTYRDDGDALLARNDALEEENERLKAELEAARNPPKPEPPKPPPRAPEPEPPRKKQLPEWFGWAWKGTAAAAAFVTLVALSIYMDPDRKDQEKRDAAAWREAGAQAAQNRWAAIVKVEPCLDEVVISLHYGLLAAPPQYDPRADRPMSQYLEQGRMLEGVTSTCERELARITLEPGLGADTRGAIGRYLVENHRLEVALRPLRAYLDNQDYQDDDYAGGLRMWRDLQPRLDAWREAFDAARAAVIPATRAIIAGTARDGAPNGATLEMGLAYRDFMSLVIAQLDPGGSNDRAAIAAALTPAATTLKERIAAAPIEVRRAYRNFDPIPYVQNVYDPAESISNLIRTDWDILADTADDPAFAALLPSFPGALPAPR